MMKKGEQVTGSLACLNLGDCSLCEFPVEIQETIQEQKTHKQSTIKKLLNKVSEILVA